MTIDCAGRHIGPRAPVFVIAEIGVNHDGSLSRALELVACAKRAGADAVKLQLFTAKRLVHRSATAASYQTANCGATDQASLLARYELSEDDVERIIDATRVAGLVPAATPFSVADVDLIERLNLPMVKIASPDLVNRPLLERVAQLRVPVLISTGAATLEEIDLCVNWMRGWRVPFALLHCVSAYPTPIDQAQLGWIDDLRRRYDMPIGYSDHATELMSGALATAAGACIIEKHLTWNRFADGPDHAASADPHQFAAYVELTRIASRMRGNGGSREVLNVEADVRRLSRQSLVIATPVTRGQRLRKEDLIVQRPGTGILAAELDTVAGQIAQRDLPAGTILDWSMIADAA